MYNHTQAADGTRNASIMIVSDPALQYPNKTIAKFTSANGTLITTGTAHYEGKVDLRFNDSGRGGENIAGTKLAQLKAINLYINFTYSDATSLRGAEAIFAQITYFKRNGERMSEKASCARYVKAI